MCWMTLQSGQDALAKGLVVTKRHEEQSGGHSWGYSYVGDNDEIRVTTGIGKIQENLITPTTDLAIVHTRLATQGRINRCNAHPMKIRANGRTVGVIAHNGTWRDAKIDEFFSDTWYMARLFEEKFKETGSYEQAFIDTADETGETMIGLSDRNIGYVYSGRFRIERENNTFQSSGLGYRAKKGSVFKIENGKCHEIESGVGSKHHFKWIKKNGKLVKLLPQSDK